MRFSVGDKVMHPGKGAGQVVDIRHQELVAGFENYYVIEIPDRELTISVPVRKTHDLGVRRVMSGAEAARVLDTLRGRPSRLPKGYRQRQAQIEEKLKTGDPIQIAEAVRDLTGHQQAAHTTKKDADLLARGRRFLVSEMALLTGKEPGAVQETIDAALAVALTHAPGARAIEPAAAA